MDAVIAVLGVLGAVAAIVQTIVVLLERSERKRARPKTDDLSQPEEGGLPPRLPESAVSGPLYRETDSYEPLFGQQPPIQPERFAVRWRSGLAYLFGWIGALVFWRSGYKEVRFHAIQSLWIDILALVYFIIALIVAVPYAVIRYPGKDVLIPSGDPVVVGLTVSVILLPVIHIAFALLAFVGRQPRVPVVWHTAAAATVGAQRRARGTIDSGDQQLTLDPEQFAVSWRSSLAYLFGWIGALFFWRNRRAEVRFHAAQSLWVDLLGVTYFLVALIALIPYIAIRYPGSESEIAPNDPVMWAWAFTGIFGPLFAHAILALLALAGRHPRIPLVWKIAAAISAHQTNRREEKEAGGRDG